MSEKKLRGLLGLEQKLSGRQQPSLYRDVPGEFNSINQGLLGMLPMIGSTKPFRAYHGTNSEIKRFDSDKIRPTDYDVPVNGFWFNKDPSSASPAFREPSNQMPVDLDLKKLAPWKKVMEVAKQVKDDFEKPNFGWRQGARSNHDEVRFRLMDQGYDGTKASGVTRDMIDVKKLNKTGQVDFIDDRGFQKSLKKEPDGGLGVYSGHGAKQNNHITGVYDLDDYLKMQSHDYIVFNPKNIKGQFADVGGGLITGLKRGSGRDWPDVKLADRREGLSEKFLEHHGYRYSSTSGKPDTYTYDKDGKIKAYSHILRKDKWGVEVKTFNNPTLKSLRDWMGY